MDGRKGKVRGGGKNKGGEENEGARKMEEREGKWRK